ncbi:RagB/SusD family nutrient uptake outer membrane protein [Pedobacter sp. SYP-B3415]|uniref:RagB/SusD family nutrient uptake outer membrane protein n=1 Tax=Pedobacter sp. SYP-B3415 TaxID=2496641 RepID=UPI00101C8A0C|nr:RagB/SusD family nutrient uptake outer membrane protein [Pedobacter sp. SYP-B3415]
MKKYTYICLAFLLASASCKKDFLDRTPLSAISDETFWTTQEQLQLGLNGLYANVKASNTVAMDQLGDNSINSTTTDNYRILSSGNFNVELGTVNTEWGSQFAGIRQCNVFLANYQRATSVPEQVKNQMAGEAKTIRAYMYMHLVSFFGDVPLVTRPLNIDELYEPRNPRKEVVDFILQELQEAADLMQPAIQTGAALGRLSKGAALGLRARMALYDGRWAEAEKSAKAVMDLGVYSLYSTGKPNEDYYNLFTYAGKLSAGANKETIMARTHLLDVSMHNISRESQVPDQSSRYNPTKSLVDSYLCTDGLPIERSPLYSEATYASLWQNRDPRMRMTILAPNSPWGGRRDGNAANTNPNIYTAPKFLMDRQGSVTITGYYFNKYVQISAVGQVSRDENDIHILRLAEMLLTYAEAKLEQGTLTQADIDLTINKLRDRVGMKRMVLSELTANGLDIRTEIRRERRVELAREGQRWFDLMRWKQGALLGADVKGVKKSLAPAAQVSNINADANGYIIVQTGRQFVDPKHYLWPVPLIQLQRNPKLGQNPGW